MKRINTVLINAKNQDLQAIISNAIYLEKLEMDGKSADDVLSEAKRALGLEDGSSVLAESSDKAKQISTDASMLISINNTRNVLKQHNLLTSDELDVLENVEKRLAEKLSKVYNIDKEQLYIGGEENARFN